SPNDFRDSTNQPPDHPIRNPRRTPGSAPTVSELFVVNIHEFQAKQLLGKNGVAVPNGTVCTTAEEVRTAAEKLIAGGASVIVVKSQIHAGGRGKGTFQNGFKGGVKVLKSVTEAIEAARNMLGQVLVTKQTGPEGRQVTQVLVDPGSNI